ncbi:phosphopantetheine-binding protein [Streptomyces sp. L2]|uniref:acyl carrier protein n=1 Tax=Streptomyces sp. L2 TaxID=2162665 RepID=UPI001012235E|nr:phosphopantetheine-binding protein [Streptomyces sp. L2]
MSATHDRVVSILTSKFGVAADQLRGDTQLGDLRFDSLALLELALTISEEFGIFVAHDELSLTHTLTDAVKVVEEKGVTV